MRNFRKYDVWKLAIAQSKTVYTLTKDFPIIEKYGISSQIQRACVSISSNIAEGCSRNSEKDFARFIEIAVGSSFEVESLLQLCCELGYVKKEKLDEILLELHVLQRKLNSLHSKLNSK